MVTASVGRLGKAGVPATGPSTNPVPASGKENERARKATAARNGNDIVPQGGGNGLVSGAPQPTGAPSSLSARPTPLKHVSTQRSDRGYGTSRLPGAAVAVLKEAAVRRPKGGASAKRRDAACSCSLTLLPEEPHMAGSPLDELLDSMSARSTLALIAKGG